MAKIDGGFRVQWRQMEQARQANGGGPALRRAVLETLFADVRSRFAEAGVPILPVKGLVTGALLYRADEERPLSDLDVRLRPRDLVRVDEVARRAGWTVRGGSRAYRNVVLDIQGVDFDVETACGPPGFTALDGEAMLSRALAAPPEAERLAMIPEWHDHAILVATNLVKDHVFGAASWAVEDARRIVRRREIDVVELVERATAVRARMILRIVARFLEDEARWGEIGELLEREEPGQGQRANRWLRLFRRGTPSWIVRIGARVTTDGWRRPLESLGRAVAYELERRTRPQR